MKTSLVNNIDTASCCANFLHNEANAKKLAEVRAWLRQGPENVYSAEVEFPQGDTVTLFADGAEVDFSVSSVTVYRSPYLRNATTVRWGGVNYPVAISE